MELQNHWATSLDIGNRVKATLRHATDGAKNIHNAEVIVVFNNCFKSFIQATYNNATYTIPYNDLTKITPNA
jgi:hypothetical protein